MSRCPRCGGHDLHQIAPGFYRCLTQVPRWSDDDRSEYEECRYEFQTTPAMSPTAPQCPCGTLAVGQCAVCQGWFCGDHSAAFQGQRLCDAHYNEAVMAIEDQKVSVARKHQARLEGVGLGAILDRFLGQMMAAGNPAAEPIIYPSRFAKSGLLFREVFGTRDSRYPHSGWPLSEGRTLRDSKTGDYSRPTGPFLATDRAAIELELANEQGIHQAKKLVTYRLRVSQPPERERRLASHFGDRLFAPYGLCERLGWILIQSRVKWPWDLPSLWTAETIEREKRGRGRDIEEELRDSPQPTGDDANSGATHACPSCGQPYAQLPETTSCAHCGATF